MPILDQNKPRVNIIRIVPTNSSTSANSSSSTSTTDKAGVNLKTKPNPKNEMPKFNLVELDLVEISRSSYDKYTDTNNLVTAKEKISELGRDDLKFISKESSGIKLNEQQKLLVVDTIIKKNGDIYSLDIYKIITNLKFSHEKNLVFSLQKVIINLKKTLNSDFEFLNYSKVDSICENFNKFNIKDKRLKAELCETIAQNFPVSAIQHKSTLDISSKKAQDRLKSIRIDKYELEEIMHNLEYCISNYSYRGKETLKSILETLKQTSPVDQLTLAKKMISYRASQLIICLNYLNLSDSIKVALIKEIANKNFDKINRKKDIDYTFFYVNNIHPHLMLALYEDSFKDKYKINFKFDNFNKKANLEGLLSLSEFVTENTYLFKNDELLNKYGKLLGQFTTEEKHNIVDSMLDNKKEVELSKLIKYFNFDEANRIKVLDKILAKESNYRFKYEEVMSNLENFDITDAEKRMKYFMRMNYTCVNMYFYSNFKIDAFIKPIKDIIKNSDDINQGYALESFTILLLKTFIDRKNIKLDDSTPLVKEFTKFIQKNYSLIQPLYQSINDIMGALFLRRSLTEDLIKIIKSKEKSDELLKLLPISEGKTNNQEKFASRQRLAIMELYSILPDFKSHKNLNIQRLHALLTSSSIYKSSPTVLNLLLDLMHSLANADVSQDLKLQLLEVCLPNNKIKNNKEYNQELCLNLSKLQLILSYANQNGSEIDEYKKQAEESLPYIKSKSELQKSYKICANNVLIDVRRTKLNHAIHSNKEYNTIPQLLNYITGMQNRLADYIQYDEKTSELDMFNNVMNNFMNILINDDEEKSNQEYNKIKYDANNSKLVAHLEKKHPELLKKWQINQKIVSKDSKVSFINSGHFKDLLEMTKNRCLDVRFSGSGNNMATPSFLMNPQYKICAIIDNKTGEILEFYRERLVLDQKTKQPIIYNGRTMANKKASSEYVKEFKEIQQKHWEEMNIPVIIEGPTEKNKQKPEVQVLKEYTNALVIPTSTIAPFDYIDDSITRRYKTNEEYIFPEKSTRILWQPPKDSNR